MLPLNAGQSTLGSKGLHALRSPLAWMWLGFLALGGGIWSRWGHDGFPVGAAWWDELALSGAAHAVQQGLVPTVDFWAPFILPIYLKALAQSLAGLRAGYVLECLLQGGLVLALLTLLLVGARRRHDVWVYVIGCWAVVQAILPFNLGSVVQADLGAVVFAGAYNRLGGALITLVILAMGLRHQRQAESRLAAWLGVVLALAFLIKVTVFQVCATICITNILLCGGPTGRWWWGKPLSLALVLLMAVLGPTGMLAPYFSALRDLSDVRASLWQERLGVTEQMLSEHRVELFALALCAVLGAWRGLLGHRRWRGLLTWYVVSCCLVLLYTLSNFGDNGLFPALALVHALVSDPALEPSRQPGASFARQSALKAMSSVMLTVGALIYAGLCVQWSWSLWTRTQSARLIHFPVQSVALARHHLIDAAAWATRPPIDVPGVTVDNRSPGTYAAYVQGLDEALQFLAHRLPDKTRSVYALDFPSYAFAVLEGYRVPLHSYPWLLYGHELSTDVHPGAAQLLSDVDVLMVSKCSLSEGNRRALFAIYQVDIQRAWRPVGKLQCWDVWLKVGLLQ